MYKTFKIRLFPTKEQELALKKHADASRFVWNWGLNKNINHFNLTKSKLSDYLLKRELIDLKSDNVWLNEVSYQTLADPILRLSNAYKRFFEVQKGGKKFTESVLFKSKKRGKPLQCYDMNGHPKFKKKRYTTPSFYSRPSAVYFKGANVNLEKIGKVKFRNGQNAPIYYGRNAMKIENSRIFYIGDKWILNISIKLHSLSIEPKEDSIGIDLGIKTLATVCSEVGYTKFDSISNSRIFNKYVNQIKKIQRKLSKKEKNSKLKVKLLNRLKNKYYKLGNFRKNYIHNVTSSILNFKPNTIVIEDLDIKEISKNKNILRHLREQGWGEFIRQLRYKTENQGIILKKADRYYPSSKICSNCGYKKKNLNLSDRVYICDACGLMLDRDENASKNLKKLA